MRDTSPTPRDAVEGEEGGKNCLDIDSTLVVDYGALVHRYEGVYDRNLDLRVEGRSIADVDHATGVGVEEVEMGG